MFLLKAEKKHKSFQELDRFMHYYTRFKNHEHSYKVIHPQHMQTQCEAGLNFYSTCITYQNPAPSVC